MNTPFDFRGAKLDRLIELLGRRDGAVYHFAEDLETCFGAFLSARSGRYENGLPPEVDRDLERTQGLAADLAVQLDKLPADIGRLIDLHILSDGAFRRVNGDADQLGVPLKDLDAAIRDVRKSAAGGVRGGASALEDKLVCAITSAYRNRFKVNPSVESGSGFVDLLKGVLQLAEAEDTTLTGLADRMTPRRVSKLLAARVKREPPKSRLELLPDTQDLTIHDPPKMKPLFKAAG